MTSQPEARGRAARLLARAQLLAGTFSSEAAYVRAVFIALIGREPEGPAIRHYAGVLQRGEARRIDVYQEVLAADRQSRLVPDAFSDTAPTWFNAYLRALIAREEHRLVAARPDLGPDERRVYATYLTVLRRMPDVTSLATCLSGLTSGAITHDIIFRTLRYSPEFAERQGLRAYPALQLRLYASVLARYLRAANRRAWPLDARAFLTAAFGVLLGREVGEAGLQTYLERLATGAITPLRLLDEIVDSAEFKQRHNLPILPLVAIHQARMLLFQTRLPPAKEIVDLGGAAHNDPRGALLMMGYPHVPERITILDLPPPDRIGGVFAAEDAQHHHTPDGTTIRYLYRSMAELDPIPDSSVDLVVSGESIEHISEADAERVCNEAFRILRPGGFFCLDTPNAHLTRLQMPDAFIHPEHQKEYYPDEIRVKLERRGFEIVEAAAVVPMPESLRSRSFDLSEMTRNIRLSDNPDEGYMFFFKARKPRSFS